MSKSWVEDHGAEHCFAAPGWLSQRSFACKVPDAAMKKIEAIIKPFKLEEVKDALAKWASKE